MSIVPVVIARTSAQIPPATFVSITRAFCVIVVSRPVCRVVPARRKADFYAGKGTEIAIKPIDSDKIIGGGRVRSAVAVGSSARVIVSVKAVSIRNNSGVSGVKT